jgi:CheY-like chemotaxis protein
VKLLIVEDEPLIAADLEWLAQQRDHVVVAIADTQRAALDAARSRKVDAALVDLKLRDGFTGVGVARALSEELEIPFAFVTGNTELIPAGAFGAAAIVKKPFSDAQIAQVLDHLARDSQARVTPAAHMGSTPQG